MIHSTKINPTKFQVLTIFKWVLILAVLAVIVGSLVAMFLWLLDQVTIVRWKTSWLLNLLPIAGVLIYFLYHFLGKNAEAGNSLIIDAIHDHQIKVPARMAPMVLFTTLITHLFGGSAGREGTAIQMGGGVAAFMGRKLSLNQVDLRLLLMTGIAAGFSAVFGTPLAGAFFAVEVIAIGQIQFKEFLPCYFTSILAHLVCLTWGIHHTVYSIQLLPNQLGAFFHFEPLLFSKAIIAAVCFGLVAFLFVEAHIQVKTLVNKFISIKWLIPIVGGSLVIGMSYLLNTQDYLGLGVVAKDDNAVSIVNAFKTANLHPFSWFWKLLFTAITLGTGFKGGEVTPMFFIGATLGNTLAWIMGAPTDLFAAIGFIAVFAGATNTLFACTIMGCELFGTDFVLYFFVACLIARFTSGYSSIYPTQRVGNSGKRVSEHPYNSLQKIWKHLKGK